MNVYHGNHGGHDSTPGNITTETSPGLVLHAPTHSLDGGVVTGGAGNDTIYAAPHGASQAHVYALGGDDVIVINSSDKIAPFGTHAFGGDGRNTFKFITDGSTKKITGRIDDFDISRDNITIDGEKISFNNLPDHVRIIGHQDQPWILINNNILYALEGARLMPKHLAHKGGDEEQHFIEWPKEWKNGVPASANISYQDYVDRVPLWALDRPESDFLYQRGDAKNDHIKAASDDGVRINGHRGNDVIDGGDGGDWIDGDKGHDTIYGGNGNDTIAGGVDNDLIHGGNGADLIFGGSGHDIIYGDAGNDTLYGNNGADYLDGGIGDDKLIGGRGSDTLNGGSGHDLLMASDKRGISALNDIDYLDGGEGNDTLMSGESGSTMMTGGKGVDHFVAAKSAQTIITDFEIGIDNYDDKAIQDGFDSANITSHAAEDGSGRMDMTVAYEGGSTTTFQGLGSMTKEEFLNTIFTHDSNDPDDDDPVDEDDGSSGADSTCFVATAAYGNSLHPDVCYLRQFRDNTLLKSVAGRAFVDFYWCVGPKLAKFVNPTDKTGLLVRFALGQLVRGLRRWFKY